MENCNDFELLESLEKLIKEMNKSISPEIWYSLGDGSEWFVSRYDSKTGICRMTNLKNKNKVSEFNALRIELYFTTDRNKVPNIIVEQKPISEPTLPRTWNESDLVPNLK